MGSFPGPWGSPPSLKNNEKVFQMASIYQTSIMHKFHFRPGLCPDPARGAYDAPSPRPIVRWWVDTPPHVSSGNVGRGVHPPFPPSASRSRRNEFVTYIGPRDNGFSGPAVVSTGLLTNNDQHELVPCGGV